MNTYRTAQIAKLTGIHPNTVRLYEEIGILPPVERRANGYRIFTDCHLSHIRLCRLTLRAEVLQSGLRRQAFSILTTAATGDYDSAQREALRYREMVVRERKLVSDAVEHAAAIASASPSGLTPMTRRQAADFLDTTVETVRNWERSGLAWTQPGPGGRRVYSPEALRRLTVVRALRTGGYSLSAILRLMSAGLPENPGDMARILDTPGEYEEIISVCDRLTSALDALLADCEQIMDQLAGCQTASHLLD